MIAQVRALADYINNTKGVIGDSERLDAVRQNHVDVLVTSIVDEPMSLSDASAFVQQLQDPSIAASFTPEQLRQLAEAPLTSPMQSAKPHSNHSGRPQSQIHYHMELYLTDSDWDIITRSGDEMSKVHVLVRIDSRFRFVCLEGRERPLDP